MRQVIWPTSFKEKLLKLVLTGTVIVQINGENKTIFFLAHSVLDTKLFNITHVMGQKTFAMCQYAKKNVIFFFLHKIDSYRRSSHSFCIVQNKISKRPRPLYKWSSIFNFKMFLVTILYISLHIHLFYSYFGRELFTQSVFTITDTIVDHLNKYLLSFQDLYV